VFRCRETGDARRQYVQCALAFRHALFATLQRLEPPMHDVPQSFHLGAERRAMKIASERLEFILPAGCVLADRDALAGASGEARGFAEIDRLAQARARLPARIPASDQQTGTVLRP